MPRGQGETPSKTIRVRDPLWEEFRRVCEDRGSTRNAEIVRFIERMVARHPLPTDDED